MRRWTPFLAATTLVAAIVAALLWRELDAERVVTAQLRERVIALESQAAAGLAGIGVPQPSLAGPGVRPEAAPEMASVPAFQSAPASTGSEVNCRTQAEFMRRVASTRKAPPELHLSAGELQQFQDLSYRQMNMASADCRQEGEQPLSAEDYQRELQQLLGAARYEEFTASQALQTTRSSIAAFRQQLASTSHPLSDEQARRLEETIVAENRRTQSLQSARAVPVDPLARLKHDDDGMVLTAERYERVLAAGQGYLSTQQLDVLKANLDRQLASDRANIVARRAHIEAGGDPARAPRPVVVLSQ